MVMPVAPGGPATLPPQVSPAGSSPVQRGQNPGSMVNGVAKVRQAIKLLKSALGDVEGNEELENEIMRCIKGLASKAPQTQTTAGAEGTQLQLLAQQARQAAPMLALARQQGQQGVPPGGG